MLPPTLNLYVPDDEFAGANAGGIDLVPLTAREVDGSTLRAVLSNSFGFGGTNASLCFARV